MWQFSKVSCPVCSLEVSWMIESSGFLKYSLPEILECLSVVSTRGCEISRNFSWLWKTFWRNFARSLGISFEYSQTSRKRPIKISSQRARVIRALLSDRFLHVRYTESKLCLISMHMVTTETYPVHQRSSSPCNNFLWPQKYWTSFPKNLFRVSLC